MRQLKIPVIVATFAAVVALGVGLRQAYVAARILDPLSSDAAALPGVAAVEIGTGRDGRVEVRAVLARDARVEEVYPGLEAVAKARLGARLGGIVIVDDPSPRLEAAYHRIHFTLYEAAATGRFTAMAREIDEALRDEEGLEYRVAVGDEHLFVHLREEGAELVRVIPRIALLEAAFASKEWTEW